MAPGTSSIIRQLIDLLLLISLISGVVSAKAPLCPRTHPELADEISEQLKITFDNLWIIDHISSNGKSKHVESFKKTGGKHNQSAKLLFLETEVMEQGTIRLPGG